MLIAHGTVVLVADGRKALLLRNQGSATQPQFEVIYGEEQPNPPDREQKSDLRGQRPSGGGGLPGQSTTGEADFHQQAEDEFAMRMAKLLNERAMGGEFEKLVIVAAPKTLGMLRRTIDAHTKACLVAEIPKNLTGYSTDRIVAALQEEENATH
jgi:protein required for attachment to host cells